jgi:hypothetical protein
MGEGRNKENLKLLMPGITKAETGKQRAMAGITIRNGIWA